jgi:hypothetical protein
MATSTGIRALHRYRIRIRSLSLKKSIVAGGLSRNMPTVFAVLPAMERAG